MSSVDKRVLIGIAIVAILGLGIIGYRAMNPVTPDDNDDGTPDTGGETPDTGGETPDTGGDEPVIGTISGTILDDEGNPVEGVLVQAGDVSDTTDSNGEYSLTAVSYTHLRAHET